MISGEAPGRPPTEQELKIPVADLGEVRRRLGAVGASCTSSARLEINVLFDNAAGELTASRRVLRLRYAGGSWLLTLKGPPIYRGAVKEREELETRVDDGEVVTAVLDRLGFRPSMRYEKERETWQLGEVEVALDHTPMGEFVEIEGPVEHLEDAAYRLGLDPERAVRLSYVGLWRSYREEHPELDLPIHMVFGA
ncbi:MAG: class IV adenylate cyclase [Acidobacteria bacterium]|jgi:adenylate cyclase, class 2|nr:class IV adenylate cyclase [Acidobacteriota bacterium]